MAAVNKVPGYRCFGGRTTPVLVQLPVQAGSTQALKIGEICQWRSYTDYATYPIIPATLNSTGYIPVIAWEEQAATDSARLMTFAVATTDIAFEFDLNTATQVKLGDKLAIHDSQTVKVATTKNMGTAYVNSYYGSTPTWGSISSCYIIFAKQEIAGGLDHMPFVGGGRDANTADGEGGEVIVYRQTGTTATTSGATTTIATMLRDCLVLDWWILSKDTNAANIKLIKDTTDITSTVAKGSSDNVVVRGSSLLHAQDDLDAGEVLKVNCSAACAFEVRVMVQPIA